MRARVCVLAVVAPRVIVVVKERRSVLRSLIGCAVLGMLKEYDKRACISTNLNYAILSKIRQPIESFFKWLIDKTDIQRAGRVRSTEGLMIHCWGKLTFAAYLLVLNL